MSDVTKLSGRCLCNAVSYTLESATGHVGACHCSMCRRWSGGVVLALVDASNMKISGEGNMAVYKSSEWGERCFCKTCGTNLFWRSPTFNHTAVMAGALVEQDKLTFVSEIFIDEKPAYFDFINETHKMTGPEFVAQFAPPTDDAGQS